MNDEIKVEKAIQEYAEKIAQYQGYIRQGMDKWKCMRMESALRLMKRAQDSPFTILGFMAALVEPETK